VIAGKRKITTERGLLEMVSVTCGKCGVDISREITEACSVMAELDEKFGTTIYSDCIARVLFADFVNSYAGKTEGHVLLCRNCDSEGSLGKLREGKIVDLAAIRKYRK
jgi:hypothetical protein